MKFTCDSCGAQYMISDEKVGPSGVKVRCKKCSNVILVRRAAEAAAAAPAGAAPSGAYAANGAAAPRGAGLDAELGQAFDQAFGDPPQPAAAPANGEGAKGDLAETQMMSSDDAAKVFASAAASPAASEWYVAIGQAQVGPLPLAEVKRKWEAGDVGPDSLVWRPGMGDWSPLTTVSDLAGYLAPVPRAAAPGARARPEPAAREAAAAEPQPRADVTWKPVGASALAALANEEIATRAAPEPRPAARPAAGVKSLVDALPDGGGVDPTGALPLNIKALETTGEKKLRTSVARGAEQARLRRSTTRAVGVGVVLGVVLVAGAAVGGVVLYRKLAPPAPPVAAAPAPLPAAPARAEAAPVPPPPAPEVPASTAPATPAVATAPVPAGAVTAAASPPPAPEPKAAAPAATRNEAPARREPVRREPRKETPRVAEAPPAAAPPAPTPTPAPPAPARKKDSLLDFESSDDAALDEALGGASGSSGRSVYVPPARAGGGGLPEKVSPGDINGAVAQRIDALRRCVTEQKDREPDATGTLKMRWLIQGDGSVRDVKCITPQYAQGAFAQCIAGVVRTIKFPRSQTTGQEVTFPFNF